MCVSVKDTLFGVQSLSSVRVFVTPWTAAHQASLSINDSRSLLKLMSIKQVMPSNHLILCHHLVLPHSFLPSFCNRFSPKNGPETKTYVQVGFQVIPESTSEKMVKGRKEQMKTQQSLHYQGAYHKDKVLDQKDAAHIE